MTNICDALLIIDVQVGVCFGEEQIHHLEELLTNINSKIDSYAQQNKPIIFVQHEDEDLVSLSQDWQIIEELSTSKGTHFIRKTHANSFYQTNLNEVLATEKCQSLEICGAQTEYCIDATIKFAHGLGYRVQMEKNLSTTYDNPFMSAEQTIRFYEQMWQGRFLTLFS